MNQSGFIAACLISLFIVYLAANNKLFRYRQLLWDAAPQQSGSQGGGFSLGPFGSIKADPKTALNVASAIGG